jgi:hypothetical protein
MGQRLALEHLPANILAENGISADELVDSMARDFGFMTVQDRNWLVPYLLRAETGELPTLTDDMVIGSKSERTRVQGVNAPDFPTYEFNDRRRMYGQNTFTLRDNARARARARVSVQKVAIDNVTDRYTAAKVGIRRSLEQVGSAEFDAGRFLRGARNIQPGQLFLDAEGRRLRATAATRSLSSPGANITAVLDQYSDGLPSYTPTFEDDAEAADGDAAPDLAVLAMVTTMGPTWVFRVRANESVAGAQIWVRQTALGGYYQLSKRQNPAAAGGTLNMPFDDTPGILETGPTITPYPNGDMLTEPIDLTDSPELWEAGRQLLCCEGELMSLRKIEFVSGGVRLIGLRRGILGTDVAAHPIGAPVFIIRRSRMNGLDLPSGMVVTDDARLKTRPYTATDIVDLVDVTSVGIIP